MDVARDYIESSYKGRNRDILLKIIDASIADESNFDQLVAAIDKILIAEYGDK